jgi:hypothetical protein
LYQILQNVLTTGNVKLLSPIYDAIYASRKHSIETTVKNILNDYLQAGYILEGTDIREQ